MALRTLVKVGGITNLSDARYCSGMGVDFLGFRVVEGQPDAIPVKTFQDIRGWITGPQIVAELYGVRSASELNAIIESVRPDFLELSVAEWHHVASAVNLPFILALKPDEVLPEFNTPPSYILVSPENDLSKLVSRFELIAQIHGREQLEEVLAMTGVAGISLNGGHEIRPGLKQYDDLSEILEALETE